MLIDPMTTPSEVTHTREPMLANLCIWAAILILAWNLVRGLIGWITTPKINAKTNLIALSVVQAYE
jgi:hypothetical protein